MSLHRIQDGAGHGSRPSPKPYGQFRRFPRRAPGRRSDLSVCPYNSEVARNGTRPGLLQARSVCSISLVGSNRLDRRAPEGAHIPMTTVTQNRSDRAATRGRRQAACAVRGPLDGGSQGGSCSTPSYKYIRQGTPMIVLHSAFDGLDIAYKCSPGPELVGILESAKSLAVSNGWETPTEFKGVCFKVAPTGAPGYSFRIDTGPRGAIWFLKKPNAKDPWGVRVSCKSRPLALKGIEFVRQNLETTLDQLGMRVPSDGVSIGRVDYAIDILQPDFVLDPINFVVSARNQSKRMRTCRIAFQQVTQGGSRLSPLVRCPDVRSSSMISGRRHWQRVSMNGRLSGTPLWRRWVLRL